MCQSVHFFYNDELYEADFDKSPIMLPVLKSDYDCDLIQWGSHDFKATGLPVAACAKVEDIKQGLWNKYFPRFVKIPAERFSVLNNAGQVKWFDMLECSGLRGLLARNSSGTLSRLYVIDQPASSDLIEYHKRFPVQTQLPRKHTFLNGD